jgi:hypothetical protein
MSSLSLEASIKTNKVNTGLAQSLHSQRYMDSKHMSCPIHTGLDTAGRSGCPNSLMTRTAGCHSALNHVQVENSVHRPSYHELIGHSSYGVTGELYHPTGQFGLVNSQGHHMNTDHNANYIQGYERGMEYAYQHKPQFM